MTQKTINKRFLKGQFMKFPQNVDIDEKIISIANTLHEQYKDSFMPLHTKEKKTNKISAVFAITTVICFISAIFMVCFNLKIVAILLCVFLGLGLVATFFIYRSYVCIKKQDQFIKDKGIDKELQKRGFSEDLPFEVIRQILIGRINEFCAFKTNKTVDGYPVYESKKVFEKLIGYWRPYDCSCYYSLISLQRMKQLADKGYDIKIVTQMTNSASILLKALYKDNEFTTESIRFYTLDHFKMACDGDFTYFNQFLELLG